MQAAKIETKKIFQKTRRLSAICALLFVGTSGVNVQTVPQFREFTPRRGAEKITKLVSFPIAIQFLLSLCMYRRVHTCFEQCEKEYFPASAL
jgi:hypothetical protein